MANFVQHEPCPRCGSKDNLARYDDGSAWCFGCSYYERGSLKDAKPKSPVKTSFTEVATLPPAWERKLLLGGYTASERALFTYSPDMDRLVFRLGEFAEARSLTKQPKVLSFGTKPFHVFGEGVPIVVVEDVFSAIKVGRVTSAVPLFGAVISKPWAMLLSKITKDVIIWLDEDKYNEAVKQGKMLRLLNLNVRVINSPQDPKMYTDQELERYVYGG